MPNYELNGNQITITLTEDEKDQIESKLAIYREGLVRELLAGKFETVPPAGARPPPKTKQPSSWRAMSEAEKKRHAQAWAAASNRSAYEKQHAFSTATIRNYCDEHGIRVPPAQRGRKKR